jgi:hypothetical protein
MVYEVTLRLSGYREIKTIALNEMELLQLQQLLLDSENNKLIKVETLFGYEPIEDVMENLKKEMKPKNLTYGKKRGK